MLATSPAKVRMRMCEAMKRLEGSGAVSLQPLYPVRRRLPSQLPTCIRSTGNGRAGLGLFPRAMCQGILQTDRVLR